MLPMLSSSRTLSASRTPQGDPRWRNHHRLGAPRAGIAVLGILFLLTLAAPVLGDCVHAPIGSPGPGEPDSHELTAHAGGEDLILDLRLTGTPGPAHLRLLGAGDRLLAESPVPSGDASIRLEGVLAAGRHPQLRVLVTDELLGEILLDEPLRLRFDCSAGECRRRIERDLKADGAVSSPQLIGAIETLRAAGRDDALAVLFDREPALRGALAELAFAWQADGVFQGSGSKEPNGKPDGATRPGDVTRPGGDVVRPNEVDSCRCSWVAVEDASAVTSNGDAVGSLPWHEHQYWYGAGGHWAAQMTEGLRARNMPQRHMTLGFQLVCGGFLGMKTRQIEIDGRPEPLRLPVLSTCSAPCEPIVTYQEIGTRLCLSAKAYGAPGNPADADLQLKSTLWIDGAFIAGRELGGRIATEDPAGETLSQGGGPYAVRTVTAARSSATLYLKADAQLSIGARSSPQPYIFASMSSRPKADIEATCGTLPPARLQRGNSSDTGGGKVLVRWGDPP